MAKGEAEAGERIGGGNCEQQREAGGPHSEDHAVPEGAPETGASQDCPVRLHRGSVGNDRRVGENGSPGLE